MRSYAFLLAAVVAAGVSAPPASAQAPASLYRKVFRATWVVKDLDNAVRGWSKMGLSAASDTSEASFAMEYRGKPVTERVRWTMATLGNTYIDFMQPLGKEGPFADFLAHHGEGILGLMYQAPSEQVLESEVARMKAAGTGLLQRGSQQVEGAEVKFVYFDTAEKGKYALGLIYIPEDVPEAPSTSRDIKQFAFVIRAFEPVSAFWKQAGFPPLSITKVDGSDVQYHGKPTHYDQQLGWQRHGEVPFEWCVPPKGAATVYQDYLDKHGEGLQHIAFNVDDMDKGIAEFKSLGFENAQSGGWGQKGKPGSGRFAYIDTTAIGGVMVELLWNYR